MEYQTEEALEQQNELLTTTSKYVLWGDSWCGTGGRDYQ